MYISLFYYNILYLFFGFGNFCFHLVFYSNYLSILMFQADNISQLFFILFDRVGEVREMTGWRCRESAPAGPGPMG